MRLILQRHLYTSIKLCLRSQGVILISGASELLRDEIDFSEYKVAIPAITSSLGHRIISAEEKAKTFYRYDKASGKEMPVDPVAEAKHAIEDLGQRSTTLPEYGEDIYTAMAESAIKLPLIYPWLSLNMIGDVVVVTESPDEISDNIGIPTVTLINNSSDVIRLSAGIDIGKLKLSVNYAGANESDVLPTQAIGACNPFPRELSKRARDGLSVWTLYLTADHASYQWRNPANALGGWGSMGVVVVPSKDAVHGGLFVSSDREGAIKNDVGFSKSKVIDLHPETGMSIFNTRPIIFSGNTNTAYDYLTFESLQGKMAKKGVKIKSMRELMEKYDVVMHLPYKERPEEMIANGMRSIAREDTVLAELIATELKGAIEPFMKGFTRLRDEFGFILDLEPSYLRFAREYESLKRLQLHDEQQIEELMKNLRGRLDSASEEYVRESFPRLAKKFEAEIEANVPFIAKAMLESLDRIKLRYTIGAEDLELISKTEARLRILQQEGGGIAAMIDAYAPLESMIRKARKEDVAYTNMVKSTSVSKQFYNQMHIEESTIMTGIIGNIDTGSFPLGLHSKSGFGSFTRPILGISFGSGDESGIMEFLPVNTEGLVAGARKDLMHSIGQLKPAGHNWYTRRFTEPSYPNSELPLQKYRGYSSINAEKLAEMARELRASRTPTKEELFAAVEAKLEATKLRSTGKLRSVG